MSKPKGRRPRPTPEPKGRGAAWTEERGTSDEGRQCLKAPRRRAANTVTAAAPQLSRTRTGAPRAQHASRGRGHRAARRRRIASPYKFPHTDTSREYQDTQFVSPEPRLVTVGSGLIHGGGLRNQWVSRFLPRWEFS